MVCFIIHTANHNLFRGSLNILNACSDFFNCTDVSTFVNIKHNKKDFFEHGVVI
jgi:hypothetical protein